jgi:hypothetical protein
VTPDTAFRFNSKDSVTRHPHSGYFFIFLLIYDLGGKAQRVDVIELCVGHHVPYVPNTRGDTGSERDAAALLVLQKINVSSRGSARWYT